MQILSVDTQSTMTIGQSTKGGILPQDWVPMWIPCVFPRPGWQSHKSCHGEHTATHREEKELWHINTYSRSSHITFLQSDSAWLVWTTALTWRTEEKRSEGVTQPRSLTLFFFTVAACSMLIVACFMSGRVSEINDIRPHKVAFVMVDWWLVLPLCSWKVVGMISSMFSPPSETCTGFICKGRKVSDHGSSWQRESVRQCRAVAVRCSSWTPQMKRNFFSKDSAHFKHHLSEVWFNLSALTC